MWEKRTLWENAAHVPLIIRVPWLSKSAGKRAKALVELVDVYPTVYVPPRCGVSNVRTRACTCVYECLFSPLVLWRLSVCAIKLPVAACCQSF